MDRRYKLSGTLVNCNVRLEGLGLQVSGNSMARMGWKGGSAACDLAMHLSNSAGRRQAHLAQPSPGLAWLQIAISGRTQPSSVLTQRFLAPSPCSGWWTLWIMP